MRAYSPATSCSVFVTSSSMRRFTASVTSSRISAIADSRFCAMRTKMASTIASSDTTVVRSPNGYGSNGGTSRTPVFHSSHAVNQTRWSTRNEGELATLVIRSASTSLSVRCAACSALMARIARRVPAWR